MKCSLSEPGVDSEVMPAVSVIVPAFRPGDFACFEQSISDNDSGDVEWIVVDDGSGPEFDEVFASLPESVQLLRLKKNRRQGAARNAGLEIARGNWIKFLDADDFLGSGHLATLLAHSVQVSDKTIVFAPTRHLFESGASTVNNTWQDLPRDAGSQLIRQLVRPFLHHCGPLFPRKLLQELGGYNETLITDEDGDLLLRVLQEGYSFAAVPEANYTYVHHSQNSRVSADNSLLKMKARVRVCELFAERQGDAMITQVAKALAQRMDKIALSYWDTFPIQSKDLLAEARRISPDYVPDMRVPLLLMRQFCGPGIVIALQSLYRRLRGRPKGGGQG